MSIKLQTVTTNHDYCIVLIGVDSTVVLMYVFVILIVNHIQLNLASISTKYIRHYDSFIF